MEPEAPTEKDKPRNAGDVDTTSRVAALTHRLQEARTRPAFGLPPVREEFPPAPPLGVGSRGLGQAPRGALKMEPATSQRVISISDEEAGKKEKKRRKDRPDSVSQALATVIAKRARLVEEEKQPSGKSKKSRKRRGRSRSKKKKRRREENRLQAVRAVAQERAQTIDYSLHSKRRRQNAQGVC